MVMHEITYLHPLTSLAPHQNEQRLTEVPEVQLGHLWVSSDQSGPKHLTRTK